MAKLESKTPISLTGIRRMHLDLTNPLSYLEETLTGTSPTVTSSDTSRVTVDGVNVNTSQLTNDDGTTSAIGKAVQFTLTAVKGATGHVFIRVEWAVAAGGSADTHQIEIELAEYVTE